MGLIEALATLGQYLPAVTKPKEKPSLTAKLLFSGLGVIIYLLMASVPLYGITSSSFNNFLLEQVVFASTAGTLAQLGIGPIITAGLIMQILVGSKLIDMDLNDTDDRSKFTTSQKGLAFVFILLESFLFGYVLTIHSGDLNLMFIVAGQLILSTFVILLLDEMIQKGWGLGSGVSLFILAGVAKIMFWDMFGIAAVQSRTYP